MKLTALLICFLLTIAANSFTAAEAQVDVNDSLALVDLYNSTNGKHWYLDTNWLTEKPVSTWYGITITAERVTSINLFYNHLAGAIPASIGSLTALTYLELSNNYFPKGLPFTIGNLVNLQSLYVAESQLGGNLPASIGNLKSLQILSLGYNPLIGSIPASIGNLSNLTFLGIFHCYLSGTIPLTIGNLSALTYLDLNTNHLTGEIPATIYNLKKITYINLEINELTESENINVPIPGVIHKAISIKTNNNKFTFNGIESIKNMFPFFVQYAPQDTIIPIYQHGNILSVSAGGTLSNNTYQWFKEGERGKAIIKRDSTFQPVENGRYYAYVTNKMAKYLTLYTDTITYTAPQQNMIASAPKATNTHSSIYPNPATNIIHIQANGTATIVLTNSDGKVLLTKNINTTGEINTSQFASGTYYIQNKTTGEKEKIVILH